MLNNKLKLKMTSIVTIDNDSIILKVSVYLLSIVREKIQLVAFINEFI